MRSGAGRCGRRGHVGGGKHSGADVQAAWCLAMLGPSAFSMKNRLQTIFGVRISDRFMLLILLIFAANVRWKCHVNNEKRILHHHRIEPRDLPWPVRQPQT